MLFSLGQFCQWVGSQVMSTGTVQIWPGTPVASPLIEGDRVLGVRLVDQGTTPGGSRTQVICPAWIFAPASP